MSTMKQPRRDPGSRAHAGVEQPPQEVVDRLAGLLSEGALEDAVKGLKPEELSGPGGQLSQLAGRVVEAALEAEMTEHLGHTSYDQVDRYGRQHCGRGLFSGAS